MEKLIALFSFYDYTAFIAPVSGSAGFFSIHLIKIIAFLVMYLIAFRAEAVPQFCGCDGQVTVAALQPTFLFG